MRTSKAQAQWKGRLKEGNGTIKFTGFVDTYNFASRFEDGQDTNPEELIGAAHAGCYSMYLSLLLTEEGLNPESINTTAKVAIDKDESGPLITQVALQCKVKCEGIDEIRLKALASIAKEKCPVSRLYAGGSARIVVSAELIS